MTIKPQTEYAPDTPGLFRLDDATYRASKGVNISTLKAMAVSPKHYKWFKEHPEEPTKQMQFGTAYHCMMLQPDKWADPTAFVVEPMPDPNRRSKEYQAWKSSVVAGASVLSVEDHQALLDMKSELRSHPVAGQILAKMDAEVSYFTHETWSGLWCKCKADVITRDQAGRLVVADLKTCNELPTSKPNYQAADLFYHAQAAFYLDLLRIIVNEPVSWLWIFQEKNPPYDARVMDIHPLDLEKGSNTYAHWLRRLGECVATDSWPGMSSKIETLVLPKWMEVSNA